VHPALIKAVNPRDPLKGLKLPRPRKCLSSCEVALIPFLAEDAKKAGSVTP
jgi:hypothetical protein